MSGRTLIFAVIWLLMFVVTWGASYANLIYDEPTLDDPYDRRQNLAVSIFFGAISPFGFVIILIVSGFYYRGFQWWGRPKKGKGK